MHVRVERSFWVLARWTFAASVAAAGFTYMLAHMSPAIAVGG